MNKEAILIADLMFAYINKNKYFPHDFEISAFEKGYEFLKEHYDDGKYNLEGLFGRILNEMQDVYK